MYYAIIIGLTAQVKKIVVVSLLHCLFKVCEPILWGILVFPMIATAFAIFSKLYIIDFHT